MTPRVLVFQHVSYCPLAMIGDGLAADAISPTIVRFDQGEPIPDLDAFDILIALGGPMDVWQEEEHPWLKTEKAAIRTWVREKDRPYLGVCLGHQLLADALGGKVRLASRPEIGVLDIALTGAGRQSPLFSGFAEKKRAVQWHGAEVSKLPSDATLLASTDDCPVTAFAAGSSAFGIQYHVEAHDRLVAEWAATDGGRAMLEKSQGPGSAPRMLGKTTEAMPELRANAERFYRNFMDVALKRVAR